MSPVVTLVIGLAIFFIGATGRAEAVWAVLKDPDVAQEITRRVTRK